MGQYTSCCSSSKTIEHEVKTMPEDYPKYRPPTVEEHAEAERRILEFKNFKGFKRLSNVVPRRVPGEKIHKDDDINRRYKI